MTHTWYRRFDEILLTPVHALDEEAVEVRAWLSVFDDTILGMPGRLDPRRRWCEDAFAAQAVVLKLGRLPDMMDTHVPGHVRAWVHAQPDAISNAFQAAWWDYVQFLGGRCIEP